MTETRAGHPRKELLLRFLRGETSGAESREVVRHLLTGCRDCVAVTKPVWDLAAGARPPKSGRRMGEMEEMEGKARAIHEARKELRQVAGDLQEVVHRLSRIQEALPAGPGEASQEDLGPEEDVLTELRAVISCVSRDCLGPALRDLLAAAAFRSSSPPIANSEPS